MEDDEHIGKRCKICNTRDYLPFQCQTCHFFYCFEHWRQHPSCPSSSSQLLDQLSISKSLPCPRCNAVLSLGPADTDINAFMKAHLTSGRCASQNKTAGPKKTAGGKQQENPSFDCAVPSCKKRELFEVKCGTCAKTFCLQHRFEGDHQCTGPSAKSEKIRPVKSSSGSCSGFSCILQ